MKEDITGLERYGFQLTPPFPLVDLLQIIQDELKPTANESALIETLLSRHLPPLIRSEVLPLILGVSPKLLYAMAHVPNNYYRHFTLPKKGGGLRPISTPRVFLKVVQRWLLYNILYRREMPEYVTGFVPKKGIIENAKRHAGHRYILRIDIKNFFPSIRFNKVQDIYTRFGFPENVATFLARLSTLDGALPQGAPTSPYIANLAFLSCDAEIDDIAARGDLHYSRYADDITLSSNHPISINVTESIRNSITKAGFRVNQQKTRSAGPGQRLVTTGLVVNVKPQPMRNLRRQLRARFHQAVLHPRQFIKEANQLLGWAAYVNSYDPQLGAEYLKIATEIATLRSKMK